MYINKVMCACVCAVSFLSVYAENEVKYDIDKEITITYKNNVDQILNNNKAILHIDNQSETPIVVEIDKKDPDNVIDTPDPAIVVPSKKSSDVNISINLDMMAQKDNKAYFSVKTTKIYGNMSPEDKSQFKTFIQEIKI